MELGKLVLRFDKENVVFNVFLEMKHHKENPKCYIVNVMEDICKGMSTKDKNPISLSKKRPIQI